MRYATHRQTRPLFHINHPSQTAVVLLQFRMPGLPTKHVLSCALFRAVVSLQFCMPGLPTKHVPSYALFRAVVSLQFCMLGLPTKHVLSYAVFRAVVSLQFCMPGLPMTYVLSYTLFRAVSPAYSANALAVESTWHIASVHALTLRLPPFAHHHGHSHAQIQYQALILVTAPNPDTATNTGGKTKRCPRGHVMQDSLPAPIHIFTSGTYGPLQVHHVHPHSFRDSTTDQPQTLCIVCLCRPHENMAECREVTPSDGEPAFSARSKLGHLVDLQGKSLCANF